MWLLSPLNLLWLLIAVVPIALYLFRHRPQKRRVSSLLFFKSLAKEHQESAWLRRLKRILSLLLTLLIIVGTVVALARLLVTPPAEATRSIVVLIDRSASMASSMADGESKLDAAKREVLTRLEGVPEGVPVSVVAYDRQPQILLPQSTATRDIRRAVESIRVRPIPGRPIDALRLADQIARLDAPASVWHYSDALPTAGDLIEESRPDPEPSPADADPPVVAGDDAAAAEADLIRLISADTAPPAEPAADGTLPPPPVRYDHRLLADRAPRNVGVTAFEVRRRPMERGMFDAFIQVHASAPEGETLEPELKIYRGDRLLQTRKLRIPAGGRVRFIAPIEGITQAGVDEALAKENPTVEDLTRAAGLEPLRLQLVLAGDMLLLDNVVEARVPAADPVRVLWVMPDPERIDPFMSLALQTLLTDEQVRIDVMPASSWPTSEKVDVMILQDWLPPTLPDEVPIIAVNPPRNVGNVRIQRLATPLPVETVRATDDRHPLLFGVSTARVSVTQTAAVEADPSRSGLDPMWVGPAGPVLAAGEVRGRRLVVMAFDPSISERLPLTASFPLLVGNAVFWCTADTLERNAGNNLPTGQLVQLTGDQISWTQDDEVTEQPVAGRWTQLDRQGLWQTSTGETGSASLLSPAETLLPTPPTDTASRNATDAPAFGRLGGLLVGDLTPLLLWIVLLTLLVEAALFHLWSVY